MNVATLLVFVGITFLGVAGIAAIEALIERACVRKDRRLERQRLRRQAWNEVSALNRSGYTYRQPTKGDA